MIFYLVIFQTEPILWLQLFPNSSPTIPDCVFIDTIDIVVGCGNSISENYDPNVNILDPNACITPIDTPSIE